MVCMHCFTRYPFVKFSSYGNSCGGKILQNFTSALRSTYTKTHTTIMYSLKRKLKQTTDFIASIRLHPLK